MPKPVTNESYSHCFTLIKVQPRAGDGLSLNRNRGESREGEVLEYKLGKVTEIYEDGFGVKVSNGEVVFTEVQPEGKKKMSARDFINGMPDIKSKILK